MLSIKNLTKTYIITKKDKSKKVVALNKVSIDFPEKGLVFLLGKSGSGKSTLLNSIGGLDSFDSGEIIIKGKSSKDFSQSDFDSYRNTFIGFIFQEYNVLENFTVAKNLSLAIELQGKKVVKEEVDKLLEQVELLDLAKRKPNQLSGGQKQRVAIARALIKNPEIIMADEPTGALDSNTGKQVMETLKNLSKTKLVIIVSHDREFAEIYGDRIIELKDGKVISDVTKKEIEAEHTKSGISLVENKYIHIKKGQKVTKDDIKIIVDQINNNANSDIIISLNDKTNKTIKNIEFIQEDGSKQAFLETKPEDISSKQYDGKSLQLIKSRLKFKDSFKMGAGALKSKIGRLIFTILLSFIAFTMFGIVDSFASWNRANSVYASIQTTDESAVYIQKVKNKGEGYNFFPKKKMLSSDINILEQKFPSYKFTPYITLQENFNSNNNIYLKYKDSGISIKNQDNITLSPTVLKAVTLSEPVTDYKFEIIGRLPQTDDEVAISKHLWNCINGSTEIELGNDYQNTSIYISNVNLNEYKKIVGLVDSKEDFSKYKDLTTNQLYSEEGYKIQFEIINSFANNIYLTQNSLNELSEGMFNYNHNYYDNISITLGNNTLNDIQPQYISSLDERYDFYSSSMENSKEDFINSNVSYKKSDVTLLNPDGSFNLKDDEIILQIDSLYNYFSNVEDAIENGLEITLYDDFTKLTRIGKFKVVGITNSNYIFVSKNIVETVFANLRYGYSGLVTSLKGSASDKELINFCETFGSNNLRYSIQNTTSQILDNFEDIISLMANIFMYVGIVLAVFSAFMLMNFISTSISYKKREIGVLRALGARGSDVFGIFFNESSIIALINFILSVIATFVVCKIINGSIIKGIGMAIVLLTPGLRQLLVILAVSFGSAFIASLLPVVKISRKKPIDAINNR